MKTSRKNTLTENSNHVLKKAPQKNYLKSKKILICILILSMIFSCFGCKSKNDNNSEIGNEVINTKSEYKDYIANVDDYLSRCDFQGSVLVAMKDDIILAKGYGLSDSMKPDTGKNTAHSTFEIGSVTKQFTATCILQLEEKGKLSTTDTLDKYFPEYKYGKQITIDMLLHMHSGLMDHINDINYFYPKDVADSLGEAELNGTPVEENITLKYFYDAPLKDIPNTKYDYCNLNYYLLACIVEQVSGQTFDAYVQKNIFDVCNMAESNLKFQGTTTKAYDAGGKYFSIPKSTVKGAGEINSSVLDMYKWDKALHNGGVLGKDAYKKMLTPVDGYGCGLFADNSSIIHGGSTDVYNSYNIIHKKDGMIIVVLINRPIELQNSTDIADNVRKLWEDNLKAKG